ncbi:hypothetical protein [uncultured Arcticibacterium sp.]|uniref:hypothetical protein n=1 Tax=uncultured Arcticibacterium sp. TaxID=2173042 RepID=UPI0030FB61BA
MNSIKNNKKHPIDELFRQKLSGFEMEPSLEAKEKFLANIDTEESSRKPFWYFSAAAGIVLIGTLSWFLLNNSSDIKPDAALAEHSVESSKTKAPVISENETPAPEVVNEEVIKISSVKKTSTPRMAKAQQSLTQQPIQSKPVKSLTGLIETDELIQDKLTLALQAAEDEKTKQKADLAAKDLQDSRELFQTSVGETIIIVASELDTEEIYLPEINSDSPITLAEAEYLGSDILEEDRSLMAKVFTELKHLKHGEKASFNAITASNEQSILNNEDGFIGHETMQFRERFRWVKGKLSKQ